METPCRIRKRRIRKKQTCTARGGGEERWQKRDQQGGCPSFPSTHVHPGCTIQNTHFYLTFRCHQSRSRLPYFSFVSENIVSGWKCN